MIKKILIIFSILLVLGFLWNTESTYTRQAIITNSKNNVVTCKDKSGYIWEYKGSARIGDNITLVIYDNHTSKITDDIVKGVR